MEKSRFGVKLNSKRWEMDRLFHILRGASCRDVASSLEDGSGQDRIRLFPKSPDYKYIPYVIHEKKRTSSRLQTTTLGASPPLILGFHPSKRHAALIASNASYPDVHSMALVDLLCFCC